MSKMSTIALVASETDLTDPEAVDQAAHEFAGEFWSHPTDNNVQAIKAALVQHLDVEPACDTCQAHPEQVDWCGSCGSCVVHCVGYIDC